MLHRRLLPALTFRPRCSLRQFTDSHTPSNSDDSKRLEVKETGQAKASIFQELFPNEGTSRKPGKTREDNAKQKHVATGLSARVQVQSEQWSPGAEVENDENTAGGVLSSLKDGTDKDNLPAVVVLSHASKSLLNSDFYRIGHQGKHVDGWNASIKRVIQQRNPKTLEPCGKYYILFDTKVAADCYREEIRRLHRVSRARVRGARDAWGNIASPAAAERHTDDATGRIFTLIPPSQRVPDVRLRGSDSTIMRHLEKKGSFHDILSKNGESDHLVLVSLEGGWMTLNKLLTFIRADGKKHNLDWQVTGSRLWLHGRELQSAPKGQGGGELAARSQQAADTGSKPESPQDSPQDEYQRDMDEQTRFASELGSRFLLSFASGPEARRFLRNWHRRTLFFDDGSERRIVNALMIQ